MTWLKAIGRGLLVLLLGVSVLLAAGILYLIIFPPFRVPETGTLEGSIRRDVTLRPGAPVAVFELDVHHDQRLFDASLASNFDPTQLTISSETVDATDVPLELRLYSRDGELLTDLAYSPDRRSIDTSVDCRDVGGRDCAARYFLVVTTAAPVEVRARLEIRAHLRFPPHVPAPFLASIGLDARELPRPGSGDALQLAEASGSVGVSPNAPLAVQPITLPAATAPVPTGEPTSGASLVGLTLQLDVTRTGDMLPVGLRAPPPVRLALVSEEDATVFDVGLRAGAPNTFALPAVAGDHRLVFIWEDWADQAYEVGWRLELATVGAAPPGALTAGTVQVVPRVDEETANGETTMVVNGGADLGFQLGVDPGVYQAGHLRGLVGVARLRLEVLGRNTSPVTLLLQPSRTNREELPVVLDPGEPVDLVLGAVGDCVNLCEPWRGSIPTQELIGRRPGDEVTVRWQATIQLWDLDPALSPYFYPVDP